MYELSHVFPNDIVLRILEIKEILGKSQNWVQSAQCPSRWKNLAEMLENSTKISC